MLDAFILGKDFIRAPTIHDSVWLNSVWFNQKCKPSWSSRSSLFNRQQQSSINRLWHCAISKYYVAFITMKIHYTLAFILFSCWLGLNHNHTYFWPVKFLHLFQLLLLLTLMVYRPTMYRLLLCNERSSNLKVLCVGCFSKVCWEYTFGNMANKLLATICLTAYKLKVCTVGRRFRQECNAVTIDHAVKRIVAFTLRMHFIAMSFNSITPCSVDSFSYFIDIFVLKETQLLGAH